MKPKRLFIIRHGQSMGNVDKRIYNKIPDYAVKLTHNGQEQALQAGFILFDRIKEESVGFYVSPYYRTRATYAGIRRSFKNEQVKFYREDPRLREHEWSARLIDEPKEVWEDTCKEYGVFFFRFPSGESCADCFDRQCSFWVDFSRDCENEDFPENVVVVGHGMQARVLLMKIMGLTVEEFELLANPKNCEFYELELNGAKYRLVHEPRRHSALRRKF